MRTIAFFSFKGGVGRTALVLNLATWWASQGRVVAVMDLDLTAPGLSYSPLAGDWLDPRGEGLGMADLLAAYREGGSGEGGEFTLLPPHLLLRDLGPNDGEGRLLLIGAGSRPYVETPARDHGPIPPMPRHPLPADATLEERAFAALAEAVREDLGAWTIPSGPAAGRPIDFLLIDARTGFAELVGLGLGHLADRRVLISGLNDQNLRGLRLTLESVLPTIVPDTLPIALTLVFSPLPAAEDEALLRRLEEARRLVAESLRYTSAGRREQMPPIFRIHYTPLLVISDAPLVDRYPDSVYAREVTAIGESLYSNDEDIGSRFSGGGADARTGGRLGSYPPERREAGGSDRSRDTLAERERLETLRTLEPPRPLPPRQRGDTRQPNPLGDLPAWHWPLDAAGRAGDAAGWMDAHLRRREDAVMDRAAFLDLLAWARGLTAADKRRILEEVSKLPPARLSQLLRELDEARPDLADWEHEAKRIAVTRASIDTMVDWAGLVLGKVENGENLTLKAPLGNPELFPRWQAWPEYWLGLAGRLLARPEDKLSSDRDGLSFAWDALKRGLAAAAKPARLAEELLREIDPAVLTGPTLDALEDELRTLAESDPWLQFHFARLRLGLTPPDREGARTRLGRLLDHPPADGLLCLDLTRLVREGLPDLVPRAERAACRATELLPGDARAWNELGLVLRPALLRDREAEVAIRKAIEIAPKDPVLWKDLARVLFGGLARYDESEEAYRKSIQLDPKQALPWNGLGYLLAWRLARYDEAEAAYRKAIALDPKRVEAWTGLGYLLLHVRGDCLGAAGAFERGAEGTAQPATDNARRHLAQTRLRLGQRELAWALLRSALAGFVARAAFDERTLGLAMELADQNEVPRQAELARRESERGAEPGSASALLLYVCCHPQAESAETAWRRWCDAARGHFDRFVLLDRLHILAGFRPDARERARDFARRLLDPPAELTERFKDQPALPHMWERFRPFAEGRSWGAGDPADGFCAGGE